MMRGARHYAVACRRPDGQIVIQDEAVEDSILGKVKWLDRPFLRGTLALIDAMALGMKALSYSATVQAEAEAESNPGPAPTDQSKKMNDIAIGGTMVVALIFGMALFVALPTLLTQFAQKSLGVHSSVGRNVIDGVIRIVIFFGYVATISLSSNIRRVFMYHGAEHKVINTWETGGDLSLDRCSVSSRIHPRCGTSFIVIVLLASIVVHSIFPRPELALVRIAVHLALVPIVAGAAYELIKLAGRMRSARAFNALIAPGLWSQRLTTREPDVTQVEVALAALQRVMEREREDDERQVAQASA